MTAPGMDLHLHTVQVYVGVNSVQKRDVLVCHIDRVMDCGELGGGGTDLEIGLTGASARKMATDQ